MPLFYIKILKALYNLSKKPTHSVSIIIKWKGCPHLSVCMCASTHYCHCYAVQNIMIQGPDRKSFETPPLNPLAWGRLQFICLYPPPWYRSTHCSGIRAGAGNVVLFCLPPLRYVHREGSSGLSENIWFNFWSFLRRRILVTNLFVHSALLTLKHHYSVSEHIPDQHIQFLL